MFSRLFGPKLTPQERKIKLWCQEQLGFSPKQLPLFVKALTHSSSVASASKSNFVTHSNERLEFLGDAVLASVIADRLYEKYPDKGEGFLTRFRARLVQRETLNKLANDISIEKVVSMQVANSKASSVSGNALEAVLGAVYIERGYDACSQVIQRLFNKHVDIDRLAKTDNDKKSRLLEWGQKRKKEIRFKLSEEMGPGQKRTFRAEVLVDGKVRGYGLGSSKKRAEQQAAMYALRKLQRPRRQRKPKTD